MMKRKTIYYVIIFAVMLALPVAALAASGGAHWGYTGQEGPDNWGDLSPDYELCKSGRTQSPVDISSTLSADVGGLRFHYSAAPIKVINNGHTIQFNYTPGSTLEIGGKSYDLLQFHFHSPSENTYRGKPYPMEAHFVHKSADGTLAVVGVFIKAGKHNSIIESVWKGISTNVNQEQHVPGTINAIQLLPSNQTFNHFQGSLTTPPCSEGVKWYVMSTPIEVSSAQVKKFVSVIGENARPVQPLNRRAVVNIKVAGAGH